MNPNLRDQILETSKDLFLTKGYKGVSMRMIASHCNTSLGNIYNYFKNKDDLFEEILRPLLEELERLFRMGADEIRIDEAVFDSLQLCMFNEELALVDNYRQELNLLFLNAHGSKYENYREYFIQKQIKSGEIYLNKMKEKYPYMNKDFSKFFIRTRSIEWYNMLCDLVTRPYLQPYERKQFLEEYMTYSSGGWEKLMKKKA